MLQNLINSINENSFQYYLSPDLLTSNIYEAKFVDTGCALRGFVSMSALNFVEIQDTIGSPQEKSLDLAFW